MYVANLYSDSYYTVFVYTNTFFTTQITRDNSVEEGTYLANTVILYRSCDAAIRSISSFGAEDQDNRWNYEHVLTGSILYGYMKTGIPTHLASSGRQPWLLWVLAVCCLAVKLSILIVVEIFTSSQDSKYRAGSARLQHLRRCVEFYREESQPAIRNPKM